MLTDKELRAHLIGKASDDKAFRTLLVNDPRQAVESEFGVTLPADISLHVHEETDDQAHLVLPSADILSERDLHTIIGGTSAYSGEQQFNCTAIGICEGGN